MAMQVFRWRRHSNYLECERAMQELLWSLHQWVIKKKATSEWTSDGNHFSESEARRG